ncbi:hypothetical protein PM082_000047 [Marasmius tenuissimus]|nr:hypothetical protein PM082_000047 [Marasmius tenuissimus]
MDSEGDTASKLLDAAKGMEERLQYFAQQLQLKRDEKKAFQEKVDLWYSRIIQAATQERENTCLKASIRESKQDIAHPQTENNNLARRMDTMRKEQEKLQGTNSRHGKAAVEKDELIEELTHAKEEAEKRCGEFTFCATGSQRPLESLIEAKAQSVDLFEILSDTDRPREQFPSR